MNTDELETVWHGSLWRESYHPKPAPRLSAPVVRDTVHTRRRAQKADLLVAMITRRPQTERQLTETGRFGTVWTVRELVQRLKAKGRIQVVGKRYGHEGPPAAVYGVRR